MHLEHFFHCKSGLRENPLQKNKINTFEWEVQPLNLVVKDVFSGKLYTGAGRDLVDRS